MNLPLLPDVSLYLYDIAQNSLAANASVVYLTVDEVLNQGISFRVKDNGDGMSQEKIASCFSTHSPTTRSGLGIPSLLLKTKETGGSAQIFSCPEKGTTLLATFGKTFPLGDLITTFSLLYFLNPMTKFIVQRTLEDTHSTVQYQTTNNTISPFLSDYIALTSFFLNKELALQNSLSL